MAYFDHVPTILSHQVNTDGSLWGIRGPKSVGLIVLRTSSYHLILGGVRTFVFGISNLGQGRLLVAALVLLALTCLPMRNGSPPSTLPRLCQPNCYSCLVTIPSPTLPYLALPGITLPTFVLVKIARAGPGGLVECNTSRTRNCRI